MTSGTGAQGILNVKGTPKMLQKWQAYHWIHLAKDKDWKKTMEKAWNVYKQDWVTENPETALLKKHFEFANKFIRKAFSQEMLDKIQAVEDY